VVASLCFAWRQLQQMLYLGGLGLVLFQPGEAQEYPPPLACWTLLNFATFEHTHTRRRRERVKMRSAFSNVCFRTVFFVLARALTPSRLPLAIGDL
jgi:hypothetical protein